MEKFRMYAYAHMEETRVIDVLSIGDFRNEITEKTPTGNGAVTVLASSLNAMKKPAPFSFTWKPTKHVPASFTTALRNGYEFSLDLRVQILDVDRGPSATFYFDFAQCKILKQRNRGGKIRIDASFNYFQKRPA